VLAGYGPIRKNRGPAIGETRYSRGNVCVGAAILPGVLAGLEGLADRGAVRAGVLREDVGLGAGVGVDVGVGA
jgi:hypothetical protein